MTRALDFSFLSLILLLQIPAVPSAERSPYGGLAPPPVAPSSPRGETAARPVTASPPRSAEAVQRAAALVAGFEATAWDTEYEDWREMHPQAVCREFRANASAQTGERWVPQGWCYRCTEQAGEILTESAFFVVEGAAGPACRLLYSRVEASPRGPGQTWETRWAIQPLLSAHLGDQNEEGGAPPPEGDWPGSLRWTNFRRWQGSDREIRLYTWTGPPNPNDRIDPRKPYEAVDTIAIEGVGRQVPPFQDATPTAGYLAFQELESSLPRLRERIRALAPATADSAALGGPSQAITQREAIEQALEVSQGAVGDDRAALLLAADRLAVGLRWPSPSDDLPTHGSIAVERIAGYRLTYEYNTLGDASWDYRHNLLHEAWRDGLQGEWAEQVFLHLLDEGWHGEQDCFREIIPQGERFLADHPESPNTLQALFAVAEAYDTWWSLSLGTADGLVEPEAYREGAEPARRKAIEAYRRVLEVAPDSSQAHDAAIEIPRLELGLDTGQRRYYCKSYC